VVPFFLPRPPSVCLCLHVYVSRRPDEGVHARTRAHTHTRERARTHTHARTRARAHTHTRTHTRTHTHRYRESVRAIAVEIHRLAEKPEMVKTNTCKSPLFVDIRDGLLVPNPSCDFAGSEALYEFVGQVNSLALSTCSCVPAACVGGQCTRGHWRFGWHQLSSTTILDTKIACCLPPLQPLTLFLATKDLGSLCQGQSIGREAAYQSGASCVETASRTRDSMGRCRRARA